METQRSLAAQVWQKRTVNEVEPTALSTPMKKMENYTQKLIDNRE